jgi:thiamine biosynthesis lipoprotein
MNTLLGKSSDTVKDAAGIVGHRKFRRATQERAAMPITRTCCSLGLLLVATAALSLVGCGPGGAGVNLAPVEFSGETMGTRYTVKIDRLPKGASLAALTADVEAVLETVNAQMSSWRDDSEISRFNQHQGTEWFSVSSDTAHVVAESLRISHLSGGAFDATIGPLVDLWGFGSGGRRSQPPSEQEIALVKARVDYRKISVRPDPPAIRKSSGNMELDLSAIAKGFGVDRVAATLQQQGVGGFLVEIGGEVSTAGHKPDGSAWRIGVEQPVKGSRGGLHAQVELGEGALATSGDYRNYFQHQGADYSHTIDPRTGLPVVHTLASVSVVSQTCMDADALATALLVLGPEAGYNLAVKENWPILMIVANGAEFENKVTPHFERLQRD